MHQERFQDTRRGDTGQEYCDTALFMLPQTIHGLFHQGNSRPVVRGNLYREAGLTRPPQEFMEQRGHRLDRATLRYLVPFYVTGDEQ